MGRLLKVLSVVVVILAVALYNQSPSFPKRLEGMTLKGKIGHAFGTGMFNLLLTAESFGFIDDSAKTLSQVMAKGAPDFSNDDPSKHPDVTFEKTTIADVPVIIFRPKEASQSVKLPALVYFHGGAFVIMSASSHFPWTKQLAVESGAVVISVDYGLAPEHPFPTAIEQGLKVTKAVFDNAEKYSIDATRIMVGGESAGGNFAAVIALELASSDRYRLKGQMLLSPTLQAIEILPSRPKYEYLNPFSRGWVVAKYAGLPYSHEIEAHFLAERHLRPGDKERFARYFNMSILGEDVKSLLANDDTPSNVVETSLSSTSEPSDSVKKMLSQMRDLVVNERAWPLLTTDDKKLQRMCPTFLSVAEFDPLRDEELLYYERLRSLGAKVSLSYMPGVGHAWPAVAVLTGQQPLSENVRTKYIPDMINFIKAQLFPKI